MQRMWGASMCQATRRDCKTNEVPNPLPDKPAPAPGGRFALRFACSTKSVTPQRTSPLNPPAHPEVPTQTVRKNGAFPVRDVSTAPGAASMVSRIAVERTAQAAQLPQTARTVVCHKLGGCQRFWLPPPPRNPKIPGNRDEKALLVGGMRRTRPPSAFAIRIDPCRLRSFRVQ